MNKEIKFDFDDIIISPAVKTSIGSRYKDITLPATLPLFTAPMDTVVDLTNIEVFLDNHVNVVLPRTVTMVNYNHYRREHETDVNCNIGRYNNVFVSLGFDDIDFLFYNNSFTIKKIYNVNLPYFLLKQHICIDVANGGMLKVVEYAEKIKAIRPDIIIMAGNIANPETYLWYAESQSIDFARLGIGNGGACWVDDTNILTNEGYKKIKDVLVGDFVLTHENKYEEVISKISYVNNEILIKINGEICTEKHEIYVANKRDYKKINHTNYKDYCYFLSANLIDENKHLIIGWGDD